MARSQKEAYERFISVCAGNTISPRCEPPMAQFLVSIRELKSRLSHYLRLTRKGEAVSLPIMACRSAASYRWVTYRWVRISISESRRCERRG